MKNTSWLLLILALLVVCTSCTNSEKTSEKTNLNHLFVGYTHMIENGIPEDVSLRIFFIDPSTMTQFPWKPFHLRGSFDCQYIYIEAQELRQHISTLRKLDYLMLDAPEPDEKTYLNARVCYIFESKSSGKILEVAMNNIYGKVFINDVYMGDNPVFSEIIEPFLHRKAGLANPDKAPVGSGLYEIVEPLLSMDAYDIMRAEQLKP